MSRARKHATQEVLATALAALLSTGAAAAPNEIKIFTDEIAGYGMHTFETHVNKASRADPASDRPIAPFRLMPEYSYGVWRDWELSLQLPVAASEVDVRPEGARVELQYVAPHEAEEGIYWGLNVELARSSRLGEARTRNLEIIPIIGWRVDRWHLVANPGADYFLSGPERGLHFEPAAKVAYRLSLQDWIGFEYYLDTGPIRHWLPENRQGRVLYLVWDGRLGKSDINVGIGRGFTDASDRWVFKAIYEISF